MTTIREYAQKVKQVRDGLLDEQERIVYSLENEIIKMNVEKITEGTGSDGNILKNSSSIFKGVYTLSTQLIDPTKTAGDLYDFFKTGDFLKSFEVQVSNDLTKISIFSTGTGSGDKADFFNGYKNLYGLSKPDAYELNYNMILPKLKQFITKTL